MSRIDNLEHVLKTALAEIELLKIEQGNEVSKRKPASKRADRKEKYKLRLAIRNAI